MFKLTTIRRGLALAVASVLGAVAAVAFSVPSTGGAAAATMYSLTFAGTDAHSIDYHHAPLFTAGGGVQPALVDSGTPPYAPYLEMGLPLPVGAKVTSISISYVGGASSHGAGSYVFGSYQPTTRNTLQTLGLAIPNSETPRTVTRAGNPITTVVAGRRYVIDWQWSTGNGGGAPFGDGFNTWYGATVRYTCTAPCVP